MSNCPTPLPSNIKEKLQDKFGDNYSNLISEIEQNLTKDCPRQNAGKKNRKSKNRKLKNRRTKKKNLKGGNRITAQRFKQIANAIFIAILSYMLLPNSAAMQTIITGFTALFSGQCGGSNYLWERIGLGNPICASYNNVIRLIFNSIAGDPAAIATLVTIFTITLKSPFLINDTLKIARYQMAKTLPRQLMAPNELELLRQEAYDAVPAIQNATTSEEQRQITDAVPAQPESQRNENVDSATMNAAQALMGLRSSSGGKRRKSRKTKKSKKAKKSRKYKKSKSRKYRK